VTAEPTETEGTKRSEAFPRSLRLRARREFLRVQDRGRKVVVGPILALALPNDRGVTRIGLTVSTKVGNAVTRVRIRRMLRELFRKQRHQLPQGIDLVLIARASAAEADFAEMSRTFDAIARKLRGMFA
jgi:ribonuclease P protein component